MNTETRINISSVTGIREAVEQIFTLIHRHLDAYADDTAKTDQLEDSRYYMHQLNAMLEMLELDGVAFVGDSIETLMTTLHEQTIEPDVQVTTVLKQAVRSVYRYLDALIDGEEDNPIKLFPVYQKIMRAQGADEIPESDLFFPKRQQELPLQSAEADMDTATQQNLAKEARMQFQIGLLAWLKNSHDKQSLQQMADAVRLIEKLPAPVEQRIFWWVSSGFLDSLFHQGEVTDKSVQRLCGKIEREIRNLNKEAHKTADRLTRELLYRIARSDPQTERMQEIARTYDWQAQLASLDNLAQQGEHIQDEEGIAPDLQAMRVLLEDINERWRKFNTEDLKNRDELLALAAQFKTIAARTTCLPLEKLVSAIHGALSYLKIRPQNMNESISLDIASSLLLLENAIENFYRLSPEFPTQVDALVTRIRAVTTGKDNDGVLPELPGPDQAGHLAQEKKLLKQLAQEILANLVRVENILDRFFIEPDVRGDLLALPELFGQISGVLNMLELDQANSLLELCQDLVEKLVDSAQPIDVVEQTRLADALSGLGFYIEALRNAQPGSEEILTTALRLFDSDRNQVDSNFYTDMPSTLAESPSSLSDFSSENPIDQPADPELLAIFIDESGEVLAEMADQLKICSTDLSDMNALAEIRRGFHTLKGSGRMVQLDAMSEVAWRVEQLLNRWLSEQKPATGVLLNLLLDSHRQFSSWHDSLRQNGTVEVRAAHLLDRVRAVIYESADASLVSAETALSKPEPTLVTESEVLDLPPVQAEGTGSSDINIGHIVIADELFNIFIREADTHIATLKQITATSDKNEFTKISDALMLAAHTLASTSQALKLDFIADLSAVLENWFTQLQISPDDLDTALQNDLASAVDLLAQMVTAVEQQQLPSTEIMAAGENIKQALTLRLNQLLESMPDVSEEIDAAFSPMMEINTDFSLSLGQQSQPYTPGSVESAEVDQELRGIFLEEARELQSEIGSSLRTWRNQPDHLTARQSLLRALHTLKGSARIAGMQEISEQAHQMENTVELLPSEAISTASLEQLETQFDNMLESIERLHLSLQPALAESSLDLATDQIGLDQAQSQSSAMAESIQTITDITDAEQQLVQKIMLRVDADRIDRLVNETGELSILRSRIEGQLYDFKQNLLDLDESIDRMRGQLREIELLAETHLPANHYFPSTTDTLENAVDFDPLELDRFTRFQELTRLMAESMDDVVTIHRSLREIQRTADAELNQQTQLNRQLQQDLIHIRTVPFRLYAERLYRVVRQVAHDTGKSADLVIQGDEIELDRSVMEKIISPLEHLLRNALVHGIETTEQRQESGKPETGRITLNLQQEGNEIVMVLQDDGAGIDAEQIRSRADQLGLPVPENETDDTQWLALIFTHGFTMLDNATDIAGRGVGLDIVRKALHDIGGNVTVASEKEQGVTFTLRFPMTLAVMQTLMLKSADNTYAIPLATVAHVQEMNAQTLETAYQQRSLTWNDEVFPLLYLPHLLDDTDSVPEIRRHNRILLLCADDNRLAVHVDTLIGQCEVVVKNAGAQLTRVAGIEGATITSDGGVVLIIDPLQLMQRKRVKALLSAETAVPVQTTASRKISTAPVVMIVDDSLTVRKVTSRLLERQGYEILIAKDGVGALQLLRETIPSIMLVDIEMPHMDGFELIRTVRNNPELSTIPIIIISSRTADKHRTVAANLGVDEFMGKPYQEDELLGHIERLIHLDSDSSVTNYVAKTSNKEVGHLAAEVESV